MSLFGASDNFAALQQELAELRRQLREPSPDMSELLTLARAGVKHLAQIESLQYRILHELTASRLAAVYDRLGEARVFEFLHDDALIKIFLPTGPSDLVQNAILRDRSFYGARALERVRSLLPMQGERVLDIGANIGNHTVFFGRICGAREVEAFEPVGVCFHALQRNAELNGVRLIAHNCALGARSATATALVSPGNLGGSQMQLNPQGGVQVAALDDLAVAPFRAMKIDVEGWAADVLEGARRTIAANRPGILVEALPREYERVNALLLGMGYAQAEKLGDDYVYLPA